MPPKRTIDYVGVNDVVVRTTGGESEVVTIGLTCASDGSRMLPLVIFKGDHVLGERLSREATHLGIRVNVCCQENAWMNEEIMLNEYIAPYFPSTQTPKLLIMDSFRAHITENTKSAFKHLEVDIAVIPGGYTGQLQPLDVGIIKPFKDRLRRLWCVWMRRNIASHNETRKPGYMDVCQWVETAWYDMDDSIIVNSFKKVLKKRKI